MKYGRTEIVLCQDATDLGRRAAQDVAAVMRDLLTRRDEIRMVLAAGESQLTFLEALTQQLDVPWDRVVCFNMDDFWDPNMDKVFSCAVQTQNQLYDKVYPKAYHVVDCAAPNADAEARRFAALIKQSMPFDILCQGIGTSGHLAFNEPGATDFNDPILVKVVDIAEQSIRQLRDDPNFKDLGYIPNRGITMTIPALFSAQHIFTMVPLGLKREILTRVLSTPQPDENLPASILSQYPGKLYVDRDSCPSSLLD